MKTNERINDPLAPLLITTIRERIIIGRLQAWFDKNKNKKITKLLDKIHPNYLSVSRAIIFPWVVIYCVSVEAKYYALAIWFFGWLTDILDGPWATVTRRQTDSGKVLDPLADRIYFFLVLLNSLLLTGLPAYLTHLWYFFLALEMVIPLSYLLLRIGAKKSIPIEHNAFGKLKAFILALTLPFFWFYAPGANWTIMLGGLTLAAFISSVASISFYLLNSLKKFGQ